MVSDVPDVSVVIPTFRRPQALREALESVLAQEGVQVEVRVLDDSPEGSAREVVEAFRDARLTYVKREVPTGGDPAVVRNEGWPVARGRYVHFLDDDDRVAAGAYRAMVAALDANPRAGMVFGRVDPFGNNAEVLAHQRAYFADAARRAKRAQKVGSRRWMATNMLFRPTVLVNSACMVRRECVAPLGGYRTECLVVEDVDFYLRVIRRFGFVFLDEVVVHYRTGETSLMHDAHSERVVRSYGAIYERYRETYGQLELTALKLCARTVLRWL
ncbi:MULTISPECIES: glycosyltransferase [Myxococcaceae]|uniref:glycosyltransferase family 2 protein n=1 Tax=Myxococcaceae TaxID=31 RepID=UPI00188EEFE4|nr:MULTISPECIES: glycosyltransferase [Myxococcaceae]MBF5043667.1 glycosyltransferase [Simulacricoccus sp. 17bor-14]